MVSARPWVGASRSPPTNSRKRTAQGARRNRWAWRHDRGDESIGRMLTGVGVAEASPQISQTPSFLPFLLLLLSLTLTLGNSARQQTGGDWRPGMNALRAA